MSKLQSYVSQQLSIHFAQYTIRENFRPEWLSTGNGGNLELDFFIEELNLALEIQGEQHWTFVPFFHGDKEGYNQQIEYDKLKKNMCINFGIRFVEIFCEEDINQIINDFVKIPEIEEKIKIIQKEYEVIGEKIREKRTSLKRELRKVEKGIKKIEKRLAECSPSEVDNNQMKLSYVVNRKDNILRELEGIT